MSHQENFTDMEGLLKEEQQSHVKTSPRLWRFLGTAGGIMAVGIIAVLAIPKRLRESEMTAVIGLESVPDNCFKQGMYFAGPIKMAGQEKTLEADAKGCQARCAGVEGCAHFTFWPDGGCMLTSNTSYPMPSPVTYSMTVVGPASCDEVKGYAEYMSPGPTFCEGALVREGPSAGPAACSMLCDELEDCKFYSIWHTGGKNWCRTTTSCDSVGEQADHNITIYKKNQPPPTVPAPSTVAGPATPGVNGTECSAYPACVAVNIASGSCCPNSDGVVLGCCNGFPAPVVASVVAAGTECAAAPGCKALNLTAGACCPTADGTRLGCCDA
mmetsp:Transcript_79125/g.139681  ORF Transcript_79125/g.139681 Transcript_79125/m.139681 type:complete len:327 (-) Transcript_79125:312-1292(-)